MHGGREIDGWMDVRLSIDYQANLSDNSPKGLLRLTPEMNLKFLHWDYKRSQVRGRRGSVIGQPSKLRKFDNILIIGKTHGELNRKTGYESKSEAWWIRE